MTPDTPLEHVFRLTDAHKKGLKSAGLTTVHDLLYYFPSRYHYLSGAKRIKDISAGEEVVLYGKILSTKTGKTFRSKQALAEAVIDDGTGTLKATWFGQPYAAKMIKKDHLVKLAGKITERKSGGLYIANPEWEIISSVPLDSDDSLFGASEGTTVIPVYPERRGFSSRWIHHAVQKLMKMEIRDELTDPIPAEILKRYNLPSLATALVWIHAPKRERDAAAARKRFAFEEIFFIQLTRQRVRNAYRAQPTFQIPIDKTQMQHFLARFPFKPTGAQTRAMEAICADFEKDHAMTRLLEGDVGSGKTLVAAATAYAVVSTHPNNQDFGNLQVAYMAPTEILAEQHFQSFVELFSHLPINIGLITGSGCKKFPSKVNPAEPTSISRAQLLKWVKSGEIAILIGTHALIQKSVAFKDLGYVIIDEQHRFGTTQRATLTRKEERMPHLLSMTATPIPRTLALTVFGDLDLTILDEMPPGRKPVHTEILPPEKEKEVHEKLREELAAGRQAYVICPRIDEPDESKAQSLRVKSVKAEYKRLQKLFGDYTIDIVHSKLKSKDKEDVMHRFAEHEIDILVSTSVVEVGVNVPNATVIVIEGGERFGLAQLHQLRGRVLRSTHQAYCYVFADMKSEQTTDRLHALKTAKNGFELAELDLKLRGPGELAGMKQWGVSDIGMEALKNIKMVEATRTEAQAMLEHDPDLSDYPLIREQLTHQSENPVHFE